MGSLEKDLIAGETVIFRGRMHWIVLFWPALESALVAAAGVAMIYVGASGKWPDYKWVSYVGIAALVLAAIFLIKGIVRRRAVAFAVTNRRIIVSRGVVDRKTEEIVLQKIESILVDQGLWGRMLDYGTVTVRGTGGTYEPFPYVAHALQLRRQVQEQIAAVR
jgi:uncharacterized membrane protein YdbT with pleckstrin-like domain